MVLDQLFMAGSLRFGAANRHGVVFSLSLPYIFWVGVLLSVACAVLPMLVGTLDPILHYGRLVDSVLSAGQPRHRQKFLLLQRLNVTAKALN